MSYYIAPRFLDKLSIHITKNFLELPDVKVPLILGIHGRKGEGKSFMCELVYKRMGLGVVYMSAGELESPDAGDPARLLRLRYREAGEWSRMHGRMAVLMINDVDAGIGRVDQYTQYTVNTQLINATLMNIADNPTNVQLPGSYEQEPTQRVPIVLTGNDFSTLYAPLIRDGRMEKFFWEPDRDDRLGIVSGIFEVDAIARQDVESLINTFPDQSIDFFSALRARLYDEQVREMIRTVGIDKVSQRVVNSPEPPQEFRQPDFSLPHLIEAGQQMVREQQRIQELRLVEEYNQSLQMALHKRPLDTADQLASPRTERRSPVAPASKPEDYFTYYGDSRPAHRATAPNGHSPSSPLSPDVQQEVHRILTQVQRLGIEYVDERRFRTGSWQCFGAYQGNEQEAIAALATCYADHPTDYIRLVAIEPTTRKRLTEVVIQRPKR